MPKKKSKKPRAEPDEDIPDNLSTISHCSSESSQNTLHPTEINDVQTYYKLLSTITELVETLMVNRSPARVNAMKSLKKCLSGVFLDLNSDTWSHLDSLRLGLEFNLKKNLENERILAANCISLLGLQLSSVDLVEWLGCFRQLLETYIKDSTLKSSVRGSCAQALTILIWFSGDDNFEAIQQHMNTLFTVFRTACLKGDGKSPVHEESVVSMQETCLFAWVRLFGCLPPKMARAAGENLIQSLVSMLNNVNVTIRIAAGEAAAVIYERIRYEDDATFRGVHYRDLVTTLDSIVSDCSKNTSKKDKKQQRMSLRRVQDAILRGLPPTESIRFGGGREEVLLESCFDHFCYDSLCDLLSVGINQHLQRNHYVRELFGLGPPLDPQAIFNISDRKANKAERVLQNQFASKLRTQSRNLNRARKADFHATQHEDDY